MVKIPKSWWEELQEIKQGMEKTGEEINLRSLIEEFITAYDRHVLDTAILTIGSSYSAEGERTANAVGPRVAPDGLVIQLTRDGWTRFHAAVFHNWLRKKGGETYMKQVISALGANKSVKRKNCKLGGGTDYAITHKKLPVTHCYELCLETL